MFLYLIKLSSPLGSERHQAEYYIGISRDWEQRLAEHRRGVGAKMLAFATQKDIKFSVIRVWQFSSYQEARDFEVYAKKA